MASRIAAHAADIAKGIPSALKWDQRMANYRKELDWEGQIREALDPVKAKKLRESSLPHDEEVCTMCAEFCAIKKMREKMAQYEAQEVIQNAEGKILKKIFAEKTHEEVRFLALNIIRKGDFVVLFGLKGEERGHLILACSENLNLDMRELVPLVSPLINGKGGGNPSLVELVGKNVENIAQALEKAQEFIKKKI